MQANGEAATLADIPNCTYATSARFGRFGLQSWANWQPLQAHPRTGQVVARVHGVLHLRPRLDAPFPPYSHRQTLQAARTPIQRSETTGGTGTRVPRCVTENPRVLFQWTSKPATRDSGASREPKSVKCLSW
jgi:hypothetical protein